MMPFKFFMTLGLFSLLKCPNVLPTNDIREIDKLTFEEYSKAYPSIATLKKWYPDCITNKKGCEKIATYLSRIYNYRDSVYAYWNMQSNITSIYRQDSIIALSDLRFKKADSLIIKQAKNHKLIVINEAHHRAEHRMFTTRLLTGLKKEGLTHLGLEGLNCSNGLTYYNDKKPTLKDGFYIAEPYYGNLIREAIANGLQVFGYDCGNKDGANRDIDASHFISNICEDSLSKILLHVGWGHVREDDKILGGLLANRLKLECNTDPLTIQQTRYSPNYGADNLDNPLYLKAKNLIRNCVIPVYSSDNSCYYDGICDMAVFSPLNISFFPHSRKCTVFNDSKFNGYFLFIPLEESIDDLPVPLCIYAIKPNEESLQVEIPNTTKCKLYMLSDSGLFETNKVY